MNFLHMFNTVLLLLAECFNTVLLLLAESFNTFFFLLFFVEESHILGITVGSC